MAGAWGVPGREGAPETAPHDGSSSGRDRHGSAAAARAPPRAVPGGGAAAGGPPDATEITRRLQQVAADRERERATARAPSAAAASSSAAPVRAGGAVVVPRAGTGAGDMWGTRTLGHAAAQGRPERSSGGMARAASAGRFARPLSAVAGRADGAGAYSDDPPVPGGAGHTTAAVRQREREGAAGMGRAVSTGRLRPASAVPAARAHLPTAGETAAEPAVDPRSHAFGHYGGASRGASQRSGSGASAGGFAPARAEGATPTSTGAGNGSGSGGGLLSSRGGAAAVAAAAASGRDAGSGGSRASSAISGTPGGSTTTGGGTLASRGPGEAGHSSASAGTSTAGGGGAGDDEKDAARRAQREKEWDQRQRLRDHVSSSAFEGKATTDFYGFGKVLGQGSFGKVRLAWHRLAGAKVAIKSYEKSRIKDAAQWKRVQQEIKLMERLNHPYVVRLLETIENAKRIHIVMEYAGGGNLCNYVKARRRLPEAEARKVFLQLLLAVEYMHGLGIIHRDIKLENVLFDSSRDMKLVDFGFSVACRDPAKRLKVFCGTPSYMAPEIVQRKEYLGRPVDIWSLGVLLYACLCGCFPFVAKTYPELYKRIAAAQLRFPHHVSNAAKDLIRRMLHPDPLKRIPLARARRHPWAAPLASAVLRQVSLPLDRSLLISDDPAGDLYEAALAKCHELGFARHRIVESVLARSRTCYSTTYYLVLYRYGRAQLRDASRRMLESRAARQAEKERRASDDTGQAAAVAPAAKQPVAPARDPAASNASSATSSGGGVTPGAAAGADTSSTWPARSAGRGGTALPSAAAAAAAAAAQPLGSARGAPDAGVAGGGTRQPVPTGAFGRPVSAARARPSSAIGRRGAQGSAAGQPAVTSSGSRDPDDDSLPLVATSTATRARTSSATSGRGPGVHARPAASMRRPRTSAAAVVDAAAAEAAAASTSSPAGTAAGETGTAGAGDGTFLDRLASTRAAAISSVTASVRHRGRAGSSPQGAANPAADVGSPSAPPSRPGRPSGLSLAQHHPATAPHGGRPDAPLRASASLLPSGTPPDSSSLSPTGHRAAYGSAGRYGASTDSVPLRAPSATSSTSAAGTDRNTLSQARAPIGSSASGLRV